MTEDPTPSSEARVIETGEPIVGGHSLFEGSLAEVRSFIEGLTPEQRAGVSIWTEPAMYTPDELLGLPAGHERDATD